jgi:hypothetical protein
MGGVGGCPDVCACVERTVPKFNLCGGRKLYADDLLEVVVVAVAVT